MGVSRLGLCLACAAAATANLHEVRQLDVAHDGHIAGHALSGVFVRTTGDKIVEYKLKDSEHEHTARRRAEELGAFNVDLTKRSKERTMTMLTLASTFNIFGIISDKEAFKADSRTVLTPEVLDAYIRSGGEAYGTSNDLSTYVDALAAVMTGVYVDLQKDFGDLARSEFVDMPKADNSTEAKLAQFFSNSRWPKLQTPSMGEVVAWSWRSLQPMGPKATKRTHILIFRGATQADYNQLLSYMDLQAITYSDDSIKKDMRALGLSREQIDSLMVQEDSTAKTLRMNYMAEREELANIYSNVMIPGPKYMASVIRMAEAFVHANNEAGLDTAFTGFSQGGFHANAVSVYFKVKYDRVYPTVTFGSVGVGCLHHQHIGADPVFRDLDTSVEHNHIQNYVLPVDPATVLSEPVGQTCRIGTVEGGAKQENAYNLLNATCGKFMRLPGRGARFISSLSTLTLFQFKSQFELLLRVTPVSAETAVAREGYARLLWLINNKTPLLSRTPNLNDSFSALEFGNCLSGYHGSALYPIYREFLMRELDSDGETKSGCFEAGAIEYNSDRCVNNYPPFFEVPGDHDSKAAEITGAIAAGVFTFLLFGICVFHCYYKDKDETANAPDAEHELEKTA